MNITEEDKIDRALDYLKSTVTEYEIAVGEAIYHREKLKIVEALEFEKIEKGGETTKRMKAKSSDEYHKELVELSKAEANLIKIKSLRDAAEKQISWGQSKLRARQQGVTL